MYKKVFNYFWSVREQFFRYFMTGFSGVFIDLGTLYLLTKVFGMNPTLSVALNQLVAMSYNFTLNKFWTFKNKEIPHKQLVKYLIVAGGNYLFSISLMYIFNHIYGFNEFAVRLGSIILAVSWNFFLYKYWVYKM